MKNLCVMAENKEFSRSAGNKRTERSQSLLISGSKYEKFSNPWQDERRTLKELEGEYLYSQPEDGTYSLGFSAQTNIRRRYLFSVVKVTEPSSYNSSTSTSSTWRADVPSAEVPRILRTEPLLDNPQSLPSTCLFENPKRRAHVPERQPRIPSFLWFVIWFSDWIEFQSIEAKYLYLRISFF